MSDPTGSYGEAYVLGRLSESAPTKELSCAADGVPHPSEAHKAACPVCNPTKTIPDLNRAYVAVCEGGTGGPCTQPDCEVCWPDAVSQGRIVGWPAHIREGQKLLVELRAMRPDETTVSDTNPTSNEHVDHKHWLAETWRMIEQCAASLNPMQRVSLSPAGCKALIETRSAEYCRGRDDQMKAAADQMPSVETDVPSSNERCNMTSEQQAHLTQIALTAANAKILGPAIMRQGMVFSLLKPARHDTVINKAASLGVETPIGHGGDVQGFLTVEGFKTRMDAARMIGHGWPLFSEDLW